MVPETKNFRRAGLYLALGFASLGGGYWLSEIQKSQSPSEVDLASGSDPSGDPRRVTLTEAQTALKFCQRVIEEGESDAAGRFVEMLDLLHPEDRKVLIEPLALKAHDDPETFGSLVQNIGFAFYDRDRNEGVRFFSGFSRFPALLDAERSVLNDYLEKDSSSLYQYFARRLRDEGVSEPSQLQQVAAIYANERQAEQGEWLAWLDSLDPEKDWDHYRGGLEGTARHASANQQDSLLPRFIEKAQGSEKLWHLPSLLIANQTVDEPGKAAVALAALPSGPWKDLALREYLYTAGEHHPQNGVDLMSDPAFLETFRSSWEIRDDGTLALEAGAVEDDGQKEFFDTALTILLETAIRTDPEVVLNSADSFYDEALQEVFRSAATDILSGAVIQEELPEGHQCGPGCKH